MKPQRVDLAAIDSTGGSGAVWSLPHEGDLDANVVALQPDDAVAEHVNDEVDVLLVGIAGRGTVTVDDTPFGLDGSAIVHIPKASRRSIACDGPDRLVYLTVHRSRPALRIGRRDAAGITS